MKLTNPYHIFSNLNFSWKEKRYNMRYQENSTEVSQIADATSDNANIKLNSKGGSK